MNADAPFDEAADPGSLRQLIAELEDAGFHRVGIRSWEGPIRRTLVDARHSDADVMTIIVQPAWPYRPPLLHVAGIASWQPTENSYVFGTARITVSAGPHSKDFTTASTNGHSGCPRICRG